VSILNPLFEAVAWVLTKIHAGLSVPFGANSGLAWALSIVILVMLMRLIMVPLFVKQVKSQRKMQAHMPQMREIQKRYKNDKQRQQEEMMKFYKENGINPLGGCLPLVAQLPVFWSLFYVLRSIAEWQPGHPTSYGIPVPVVESALSARIFGALLSDKVLFTGTTLNVPLHAKVVIVLFVAVSATTTFLTMRQSQKRGMMQQGPVDPDNPAANMTKYMMYISPLFALTGLYWQFGLVIYWVTTNVWTLGQQHILFRNLPMVGSTTADSSTAPATRPASAGSAAAKSGTARTGTAKSGTAKTGTAKATAARSGTAKPATAKPATAKTATAKTGTASGATAAKPKTDDATSTSAANGAPAKSAAAAKPKATQAAKTQSGVNGTTVSPPAPAKETVQDTPTGSGPLGGLLRFGKGKTEPEPEPVEETKVVRQQPVRQTRSKRSGKR
jgi:YidC/Oxa1 family membrane protein insertase